MIKAFWITAMLMAAPAAAQDNPCAMMGMMAKEIMAIRQMGGNMSDLMGPLMALDQGPERDIAIAMVKDAYAQPRYIMPDFQRQAINDFRNGVEALCYAKTGEGI
jgi:hypothetical protein